MAERFKAPVLKTGVGASPPWVRIPLPPPCMPLQRAPQDRACARKKEEAAVIIVADPRQFRSFKLKAHVARHKLAQGSRQKRGGEKLSGDPYSYCIPARLDDPVSYAATGSDQTLLTPQVSGVFQELFHTRGVQIRIFRQHGHQRHRASSGDRLLTFHPRWHPAIDECRFRIAERRRSTI